MSDTKARVFSNTVRISLKKPLSGDTVAEEMVKLLTHLGQNLNYKGKIIGHIKAIVEAGEDYIQMSLTSLPDINIKAGSTWYDKRYGQLSLTVNIIVFGYEKNQLEMLLQEGLRGSIFNSQKTGE